ncbi:acyltransferase [Desulfosporosinus sp. PR]|uniref:acyltransferase n=1 Tax=Candidatus Desulfosporosinus nitrosoreducens TaxID=3401928 RepID=UPI0027E9DF99|nr:acyltransferase [Desulfosporosinus sp. PR]MDQ7095582.1 acyltransferase [Desulfosporosinus sp. PR]
MSQGNSIRSKSSRIEEINFLRGFSILAVLAIHTSGYFTVIPHLNTLTLLNIWTDVLSQFAVPLFIAISGFVLAKNYRRQFSLSKFYLKRARSILPQYIIFSVLYTAFNHWTEMRSNPFTANFKLIGKSILNSDASYHLWFFAIIIELYAVYPLIIKAYDFCKRKNISEHFLAGMLVLQVLWMVGTHTSYANIIKVNAVAYLFYFSVGIYSHDHFLQLQGLSKRLMPLWGTMSLTLMFGASFFIVIGLKTGHSYNEIPPYITMGSELVYPVLRIVTFLFFWNLAGRLAVRKNALSKIMAKLGDYSFGIYLIHLFFNQTTIKILGRHQIGPEQWAFYPLVFTVTLIISYVSVRLISFLPFSFYLIGLRSPKTVSRKAAKGGGRP